MNTNTASAAKKAAHSLAQKPGETRSPRMVATTEATAEDRIRTRAFELYEARTANGGVVDPLADWLQAEQEVTRSTLGPSVSAAVIVQTRASGVRPRAGVQQRL